MHGNHGGDAKDHGKTHSAGNAPGSIIVAIVAIKDIVQEAALVIVALVGGTSGTLRVGA
jgi:hypothetical protein